MKLLLVCPPFGENQQKSAYRSVAEGEGSAA